MTGPSIVVRYPQMMDCSWCGGHGLRYAGEGIDDCFRCGGSGQVEARDERGRFLPWRVVVLPDEKEAT